MRDGTPVLIPRSINAPSLSVYWVQGAKTLPVYCTHVFVPTVKGKPGTAGGRDTMAAHWTGRQSPIGGVVRVCMSSLRSNLPVGT